MATGLFERVKGQSEETLRSAVVGLGKSVAYWHRERRVVGEALRTCAQAFHHAADTARSFSLLASLPLDQADRLSEIARAMDHLWEHFEDEWPFCTPEEAAEALAQAARGEAMGLDDAFAHLAGVDKGTWLDRVAAYQQARPTDRQE